MKGSEVSSVNSKSMCSKRVLMRIWEDSKNRVKTHYTKVLTCWFGVMIKFMVWHREVMAKTEWKWKERGVVKEIYEMRCQFIGWAWISYRIVATGQKRGQLSPYVKDLQPLYKRLLNQVLGPICFSGLLQLSKWLQMARLALLVS